MRGVYLDHNATSPLREEVWEHWRSVQGRLAGNPSSLHAPGREARHVIDEARGRLSACLDAEPEEITFTSGGTESNNLALLGTLRALRQDPGGTWGLVTVDTEHASVLAGAARLELEGHPVVRVPVDGEGLPSPDELVEAAGEPGCGLVSMAATNNETGVCPPLEEIFGRIASARAASDRVSTPLLHTDAVQALGKRCLTWKSLGADLASLSAHKIGGPIGVGVLLRRKGVALQPLMYGGAQEGGLRPGTESAAAISSAALAIELACNEAREFEARARTLERMLLDALRESMDVRLLGPPLGSQRRQAGTLNVLFPNVDGKVLVTRLDVAGLAASAGSACASGSLEPSHVLLAMGLEENEARAGLRLSFGRTTREEDAQLAVDILRKTLG